MRTIGVLILILHLLWAQEKSLETHLRPGALLGKKGRIHLIEDQLWIRIKLDHLFTIPNKLNRLVFDLERTMEHMSIVANTETNEFVGDPHQLTGLLIDKFEMYNATLQHAIREYGLHQNDRRVKRGLINALGYVSQTLFGTAMDDDVKQLRNRYNQLVGWATYSERIINYDHKNLLILDSNIKKIQKYTNKLTDSLNHLFARVDQMYALVEIMLTLSTMEQYLAKITEQNEIILKNIINAGRGKVTPELISLHDLKYLLYHAQNQRSLTPIFQDEDLMYYYNIMDSFVSTDSLIIHIPFESKHSYELFQLEPFPMLINNSIFIIDWQSSLILTDKDYTMYTRVKENELTHCHSTHVGIYFCPASLLTFIPVRETGVCEMSMLLKNATLSLEWCPFKEVPPNDFFHTSMMGYHYFLFPKPTQATVKCAEGQSLKRIKGSFRIRKECSLNSLKVISIKEMSHQEDLPKRDNLINTLKINGTQITYVTNKLHKLYLANISTFHGAVKQNIPGYLQPSAHYPIIGTTFGMILILIIIIVPICCFYKKASSLFTFVGKTFGDKPKVKPTVKYVVNSEDIGINT